MRKMIAGLLCAICVAGALSLKKSTVLPEVRTHGIERQPAKTAATADNALLAFNPRENHRYTYEFSRRILFHGLPREVPEVAFHGVFTLDIIRSGVDGFEASAQAKIAGSFAPQAAPLWIRVGIHGNTLSIKGRPFAELDDSEQENEAILKDLIAHWVFTLQRDTVGDFEAAFTAGSGQSLRFRKVKLRYLDRTGHAPEILASDHLLLWNPTEEIPQEVTGTEMTRLPGDPHRPAVSAESAYTLRLSGNESSPALARITTTVYGEERALTLVRHSASTRSADNSALNWPATQARLAKVGQLTASEQLGVFGDLIKLLKLGKVSVEELAALSRSIPEARRVIIGALASAGTPEAQAALVKMYETERADQGLILTALTTTQAALDAPTRAFLTVVMETDARPEFAQGAAFAVGSGLRSASPSDPQAAQDIAKLHEAWRARSSESDATGKLALLDAFGNSGRAEFLPELHDVIQSGGSSSLRAKAVLALRFVPGEEAATTLVTALSDVDPRVRVSAAEALQAAEWRETFRLPLEGCATRESVPSLRSACSNLIATRLAQ